MLPVAAQPLIDFSDAEDAVIIEDPVVQSSVSFLDANTNAISLEDLASTCVVPTWGNQDLTISHQDFINCIHETLPPCRLHDIILEDSMIAFQ